MTTALARHHLAALRRRYMARPNATTRAAYLKAKAALYPPRARATSTSQRGLQRIAGYEGFVGHAYRDAVGVWTIGYGHTGGVKAGQRVTQAQALGLLRADVKTAEWAVLGAVKVPLNQNQLDALVSFVYNVGAGAFRSSTLLRKLNAKDYRGAADELLRWDKGGGHVLPGLAVRRHGERALFLS